VSQIETQYEIRDLKGIQEMAAAEALQKVVWKSDEDFDNKDILTAIQHAGGMVVGAFDPRGTQAGFIFGFPTIHPHVFHSHRLAVLPAHRRHGLGEKLKWFQRDWCLARSIDTVQWTTDPLRTINADLNIRCLGAISKVYYENYYGEMDGINAGAPSDRILMEWNLTAPRVLSRIKGDAPQLDPAGAVAANPGAIGTNKWEVLELDAPLIRINLPEDFGLLLTTDLEMALNWRLHIREALERQLSRGYFISQFTRMNGPAYLLERSPLSQTSQ
jgi:predicted GNAT superfamily acetyltransferase